MAAFPDISKATGPVTIPAGDYGGQVVDLSGVKVASITLSGVQNLTLKGLEASSATGGSLVYAKGSTGLTFEGLRVHAEGAGGGFFVRECRDIKIRACEVSNVGNGIEHLDCTGLLIEANKVHDFQADGIHGGGSGNVIVRLNEVWNGHSKEGDHPDGIQFWGPKEKAHTIVIARNVIRRGSGTAIQGIFLEDLDGVQIIDNVIDGPMYNGISLDSVDNAEVAGNTIVGWPDFGTRIIIRGASANVNVHDNEAPQVADYLDKGPNPGLLNQRNAPLDVGSLVVARRKALPLLVAARKARSKNPLIDAAKAALA